MIVTTFPDTVQLKVEAVEKTLVAEERVHVPEVRVISEGKVITNFELVSISDEGTKVIL